MLSQDDAISVEDLDKVMTDGLGMRYAFMGPLETCHLNAEGEFLCPDINLKTSLIIISLMSILFHD